MGEWTDNEMNKLSIELESSTDRARRKAVFARTTEICEQDPAYTGLAPERCVHGKRKDIKWKAAPSFAMVSRSTTGAEEERPHHAGSHAVPRWPRLVLPACRAS